MRRMQLHLSRPLGQPPLPAMAQKSRTPLVMFPLWPGKGDSAASCLYCWSCYSLVSSASWSIGHPEWREGAAIPALSRWPCSLSLCIMFGDRLPQQPIRRLHTCNLKIKRGMPPGNLANNCWLLPAAAGYCWLQLAFTCHPCGSQPGVP